MLVRARSLIALAVNKYCIVLHQGCDVPFILRRIDQDHHVLIGEAYIHGLMDGYLMKGFQQMKQWERTFKIL
jgi:hypothetical protein